MVSVAESTYLPLFLVVIAASANAFTMVCTEYLEIVGATWYQTWVAEYWICLLLVVFYWFVSFGYEYYFQPDGKRIAMQEVPSSPVRYGPPATIDGYASCDDNYYYHGVAIVLPEDDTIFDGDDDINNKNCSNFLDYLFTVFPPIEEDFRRQWLVLIIRSLAGIGSFAGLDIALLYLDSGDTILIQVVLVTLMNISYSVVVYGEKLNRIIIVAIVVCLVGLLLVTQPSFLFGGESYDTVSIIGFVVVFLSSIMRALVTISIKYSNENVEMPHDTMIIVPQILMGLMVTIVYFFGIILPWLDWNANVFVIVGDSSSTSDERSLHSFYMVSLGFLFFIWIMAGVIGFRLGDLGRLGIIQNSEVVITYLFDALLLNEDQNFLCYLGVCLTLIGCAMVFYEHHATATRENEQNTNITIDNGSDSTL